MTSAKRRACPGEGGRDFDLISYGKDGVEGGSGHASDLRLSEVR